VVVVALCAILLFQVAVRLHSPHTSGAGDLLAIGEPLPFGLANLGSAPPLSLSEGCWVLFLVDPACPACASLAGERGRDTGPGQPAGLAWVSAGTREESLAFAATHHLPLEWVFLPRADRRGAAEGALRRAGVVAVPTRVVVRTDGLIADILLTHAPPEGKEISGLCTVADRPPAPGPPGR
jgi:hypothetical protein